MDVSKISKDDIGSFAHAAQTPTRDGDYTMTAQAIVRGFDKIALPLFNFLVLGGVSLIAATVLAQS